MHPDVRGELVQLVTGCPNVKPRAREDTTQSFAIMAVEKTRSFRVAENDTNVVIIGAKAGEGKDVELMEAIPQEKQLTVTFSSISGWVPLMHKADPPMQKIKNIFTSKQEVHEAGKVQRKQVRTCQSCFSQSLST